MRCAGGKTNRQVRPTPGALQGGPGSRIFGRLSLQRIDSTQWRLWKYRECTGLDEKQDKLEPWRGQRKAGGEITRNDQRETAENEESWIPQKPEGKHFRTVWTIKPKLQQRCVRKRGQWTGQFKKSSVVTAFE